VGTLKWNKVSSTDDVFDMLRVFYLQTNPSLQYVNNRMNVITYKTSPYRFDYIPSSVSIEQVEQDPNWRLKMLNNINSRSTLIAIMKFISKLDNVKIKKALIIQFMSRGLHVIMRDDFHLVEDLREIHDPTIEQLNDDYISNINEKNKILNKSIEDFKSYSKDDVENAQNLLYDFIGKNLGKEALDLAMDYGMGMYTMSNSNLENAFEKYFSSEEVKNEFIETLIIYRSIVRQYDSPSYDQLRNHFNLSPTQFKSARLDGLDLLIKTFGKNLLRDVI
jgi:hypothetical protein